MSIENHPCARTVIHNARVESFGARLARERKKLNLTQGQVAQAIGVSQRAISSLENTPDRVPTSENLRKLAAFFDVDPDWLLTGKGSRTPVTASNEEAELLLVFRALTPTGQQYVLGRARDVYRDEHDNAAPPKPAESTSTKLKRLN